MLGKLEWLCLVLSRTAVAVWLNMSKRKRFPDFDDYADWVVADAKEMDWVARHAHLRLYSHNATFSEICNLDCLQMNGCTDATLVAVWRLGVQFRCVNIVPHGVAMTRRRDS